VSILLPSGDELKLEDGGEAGRHRVSGRAQRPARHRPGRDQPPESARRSATVPPEADSSRAGSTMGSCIVRRARCRRDWCPTGGGARNSGSAGGRRAGVWPGKGGACSSEHGGEGCPWQLLGLGAASSGRRPSVDHVVSDRSGGA
jgi:hypothetical protein